MRCALFLHRPRPTSLRPQLPCYELDRKTAHMVQSNTRIRAVHKLLNTELNVEEMKNRSAIRKLQSANTQNGDFKKTSWQHLVAIFS